jgi:O-antigen ligase
MDIYEKIRVSAEKKLNWVAYLIAYPFWVIVQNVSFFVMISFYLTASRSNVKPFRINGVMSIAALLTAIASVISSIGAEIKLSHQYFFSSLSVLPNYLYWTSIVIILGNIALKFTDLVKIYKYIFWGIISTIITYHLLFAVFSYLPIFKEQTPNGFAFILITFSPIATSYLHNTKKNLIYTISFILIVTLAGFLSGSRSGSLLTLIGGFAILAANSWQNMTILTFAGIFLTISAPQIMENPSIKNGIRTLNERTYSILYETENTLETDRSYLTRLAMIEKGMGIFEDHPITGVGVGNFTNVEYEIQFDFEGGHFIERLEDKLSKGTSAHNSYINFLTEGGLLMFIPILILILYPIFYFITNFNNINTSARALFISIIMMSIHSWFISGMVNVYAWFLLGITNSYIIYKNKTRLN